MVTHGQGQRWYEITLTGFESHAGSTPMPVRKDALLGAARIVELVNKIGLAHAPLAVSTVGMINSYPNSRNVIPGQVFLTVDFRHPINETLTDMDTALRGGVEGICQQIGLTYEIEADFLLPARRLRPRLRRRGAGRGRALRLLAPGHRLGRGPRRVLHRPRRPDGDDFTPCVDGISHNETEDTKPESATAGANVLMRGGAGEGRDLSSVAA